MSYKDAFKLAEKIQNEIKKGVDNYHTGLLGEQLIVASYQTMETDKLEKMRFIINKIIKKRKDGMRFKNVKINSNGDSSDNVNKDL